MIIKIPELALVVLIGTSGSGKSTFAKQHFLPTEVISSDYCRALVSDDETNQAATSDAFEVLHFIAAKRLALGRMTVIDATNVQAEARQPLVKLAREYHVLPVAIVLDVPEKVCQERNAQRSDRNFGEHVIRNQQRQLRQSIRRLEKEGFRSIFVLNPEQIEQTSITRERLWNNRKDDHGPFDIIGDIHGCYAELCTLLNTLGYQIETDATADFGIRITPPNGRKAVFLGDLNDRGPNTPAVLRLVMSMMQNQTAYVVMGNHDRKLQRKLHGRDVQITHGLAETLEQLSHESPEFIDQVRQFLDDIISHYVLDGGKLVVAHAGLKESLQGRASGRVREFAMFGETTGETDEFGLPVRFNWAGEYRGKAMVVYGHTPIPEPTWLNNTINIDTGCVFGGFLTALRYPEREIISVPAAEIYHQPVRPLAPNPDAVLSDQQQHDQVLNIDDVMGKRIIQTSLYQSITIREEQASAALEAISRFALEPQWLVYLPPTMSPSETSNQAGYLEYPTEAFNYYRQQGVAQVICQTKHMGSRAVLVVCRSPEAAQQHFGVLDGAIGACYTRTGRRFFDSATLENEVFQRVQAALTKANFWEQFNSDWFVLDCEIMPWSAKAQGLIRSQYAAVGAAASTALQATNNVMQLAQTRGLDVTELSQTMSQRANNIEHFIQAYRQYCWDVASLDDWKIAPFHLLASEGKVHIDQTHLWHMQTLAQLADHDPLLLATEYRVVDVTNPDEVQAATQWWETLTNAGGEGMVVKPLNWIERNNKGLVQPAVKCRGREYLRIIYGPEYTAPVNLERLRQRGLGAKRSLALREFALGIEGLQRFVRREPLRRVHECVFGVLALESEPIDPRL